MRWMGNDTLAYHSGFGSVVDKLDQELCGCERVKRDLLTSWVK